VVTNLSKKLEKRIDELESKLGTPIKRREAWLTLWHPEITDAPPFEISLYDGDTKSKKAKFLESKRFNTEAEARKYARDNGFKITFVLQTWVD
jgi:hypothetical protein